METDTTLYRSCTPVVDTWYKNDGSRTIPEAIVDAIAEAEGKEVTDISPLYESIDLESLSRLFEGYDGTDQDPLISFSHEHWNVFVRADGRIRVCDATRATDPKPVFEGRPVP